MKNLKAFFESRSIIISLLISIAIILLFYQYRWGLNFLNPFYINWIIEDTELANGFFSFGYFRYQDLIFPIGKIESYFYPIGTNLYTTDIPLLALFFKLLSPILPQNFQYIGIWYLISHVLQAWFTILLCERFGIRGLSRMLVVVFLLFAPVMMFRYMHPSLFCQWMLLAGLYIYFLDPEKVPVKKILNYQLLLFIVSGLEFAYIWAMIFGFSVALFWRLWLVDKKLNFFETIKYFGFHMAIMICIWLLIGLFSLEEMPNYQMEGWGSFTLNLNALYNPMGKGYFLPELPYYYPQYEGYAYLGAGVLLLLMLGILYYLGGVILKQKSKKISFSKIENIDLRPLFYFFMFSLVFSLSNTVRFNNTVIMQYPIPDAMEGIVNSFRSSGRFFWPVYYFIFFAVFYLFYQSKINSILKNFIVAGCLFIQLYDIQYYLRPVSINYEAYRPPINPVWENLIKEFDHVAFVPGFRRSYLSVDDYRFFTYYTTLHHKTINVGYPARFDPDQVNREIGKQWSKIYTEGLDNETLYISLEPYVNSLIVPIYGDEVYCFSIDGYLVIFNKNQKATALASLLKENNIENQQLKIASQSLLKPWNDKTDSIETREVKSGLYEVDHSDDHFFIKGWAFHEKSIDIPNDCVSLVIESVVTKKRWITSTNRFGTSDVVSFFNRQDLYQVGFGKSFVSKNLRNGSYRIGLLFTNNKTKLNSLYWLDSHLSISRPAKATVINKTPQNAMPVKFDVNVINDSTDYINIESWAFPQTGICKSCKPYFTLSAANISYKLAITPISRPDVASFFKDTTLLNVGCNTKFKKGLIHKGSYKLGILFEDTLKSVIYFSETNKTISVGLNEFSTPQPQTYVPPGNDSIRAFIDIISDKTDSYQIEGWAFIDSLGTDYSTSSIILKSDKFTYQLETNEIARPDLKAYFNLNYDTDRAGFKVKFKKNKLHNGRYQICVLVTNLNTKIGTLSCLDSFIDI